MNRQFDGNKVVVFISMLTCFLAPVRRVLSTAHKRPDGLSSIGHMALHMVGVAARD